jgi:hypothetical protein
LSRILDAIGLAALAVATAAGCSRPCKAGTVLLDVGLDGGAETADSLVVIALVDGVESSASGSHVAGVPHGTIEIDFASGYPRGKTLTLTVTALAAGQALASDMTAPTMLIDSCASLSVHLHGSAAGDLAGDPTDLNGATADLASPSMADMVSSSPADLAPQTDLASSGQLGGTRDSVPNTIDLTAEGTIDWVHFGLSTPNDINRKAGGPAEISVAAVGAAFVEGGPFSPMFSWSNGAPTASASTSAGVYIGGVGNAITVTVPADATARSLRLYLLNFHSTGTLTAHLSDSSAVDYVQSLTTVNGQAYRVTILFHAGSAAQTLTVTWALTTDTGAGSVDFLAATVY